MFAIDKINKHKPLHSYIQKFDSCEQRLTDTLEKFKCLNIKDTERISRIYEATNPSSGLLLKLRESRLSLQDCVQERHNIVHLKLTDIERYIDTYVAKRTEEASLIPGCVVVNQETIENYHNFYIENKNLIKLVNCIKLNVKTKCN